MAKAKGRFLSEVNGMIENSAAHYMYQKNGKSFVAFKKKSWNRDTQTDTQKIQCVNFSNTVKVGNAIWVAYKASDNDTATEDEKKISTEVFKHVASAEDIKKAFYAQDTDDNGIHTPCATIHDFIQKNIAPKLEESAKESIITAVGKTYYEPSLEGYKAMKSVGRETITLIL